VHLMHSTFVSSGVTAVLFWISVGVLFYAYLGYPLLVFILARAFPRPLRPSSSSEAPAVTLLIAAYNEEAAIRGKIRNALEIDYPRDRFQILVVNDGSSDATAGIVREFSSSGVELHDEHERHGKMAAISRAIPDARGEIIVFSDANNLYLPETIRKAVDPFKDPAVGGVSGAKVIEQGDGNLGASEGLYWKYESFIKVQETRFGSCTSATGEILAIRKSLYRSPTARISSGLHTGSSLPRARFQDGEG
jgi:poly-beta-1,6-N-acetyl-D-glucosamine synthase